jgi:ketosteroid isomerase-like protein
MVDAFSRRDQAKLVTLFSPDVELWTRVQVLSDKHFTGLDGVRDWLDAVEEGYDRFEIIDPTYTTGTDGAVVMSSRLSIQYAGDSYGQSRSVHWVLRVDEERGLIVSFRSFRDRAEALEEAGVSRGDA